MELFFIYEDCKLIKGYKNNVLYDLTRGNMYEISDELFEINQYNRNLYSKIPDSKKTYADFLINHEFATLISSEVINLFPKLSTKNQIYGINGAIIFCKLSLFKHNFFIKTLTQLGAEYTTIKADLYTKRELLKII